MWLALQHSEPNNYVLATGVTTSIREFCMKAFKKLNIELIFKGEGKSEQAFDAKTGKLILDITIRAMKDLYEWEDNDEIIIPSFNIISAAQSCIYSKLKPVFVDAEEKTWNIDK